MNDLLRIESIFEFNDDNCVMLHNYNQLKGYIRDHKFLFENKKYHNRKNEQVSYKTTYETYTLYKEYIRKYESEIKKIINKRFNNKYKNDIYNIEVLDFIASRLCELKKLIINNPIEFEDVREELRLLLVYIDKFNKNKRKIERKFYIKFKIDY